MEKLNKYKNIEIDGCIYDLKDLIGLYRLQKQLLLEEGIVATLEECIEIWQTYSNNLCASWLFFPEKDESILKQIKSDYNFNNFEDYIK